jgi:hypothetical protein
MRKLRLIIPFNIPPKIFFLILMLICINNNARGDVIGCHVIRGSSDVLYYLPYGLGSPSEWITRGIVNPTGAEGGFRNDGTQTYGCIKDIGGACTVYQEYEISSGPPQVVGVRVYKTGIFGNIDHLNCPLDDYLPYFILYISILVIYKRKSWLHVKV